MGLFTEPTDGGLRAAQQATNPIPPALAIRVPMQRSLWTTSSSSACATTALDRCRECQTAQDARVDDCWSTCFDAQSTVFADCSNICGALERGERGDYACKDIDETECTSQKYTFGVAGKVDTSVERACEGAVARAVVYACLADTP